MWPPTSALDRPLADVFRYLSLLLTLPVVWMLGLPLAESAWQQLRRGRATTDLLLLSGVAAAIAYSAVSVFRGQGHVYFEVACVVLVAVTLGRWFESTGKAQANRELDAMEKLIPLTVVGVRAGGDQVLPAASVVAGDVLRVIAGERLPVDGEHSLGNGGDRRATRDRRKPRRRSSKPAIRSSAARPISMANCWSVPPDRYRPARWGECSAPSGRRALPRAITSNCPIAWPRSFCHW